MLRRLALVALLAIVLLTSGPVFAEHTEIDPEEPPPSALSEEEAAKITDLRRLTFGAIESSVSPDDAVFLVSFYNVVDDAPRLAFVDVERGEQTAVDPAVLDLPPLVRPQWADARTLTYLSERSVEEDERPLPVVVSIDRVTGAVSVRDIELPGFPISLSPDGSRALIELPPPEEAGAAEARMRSRFDVTVRTRFGQPARHTRWSRPYDENAGEVRAFASEAVSLGIFDLRSGAVQPLTTLPEGSELVAVAWNPAAAGLALARISLVEIEDLDAFVLSNQTTQDALGNYAPGDNPFVQNNVIEVFDLTAPGSPPVAARRAPDIGGELVVDLAWAPDGQTLMASMLAPSRLAGRKYPTFLFGNDFLWRFFTPDLAPLGSFDRPELVGTTLGGVIRAEWASPDEIFFGAPQGLNRGLFYYNRRSGEFRALPVQEGFVEPWSWITTRLSRRLVYVHHSLYQPDAIYRISWEGQAIARLTWENAELEALNQVRVNRVEFRLASGARREGLLVQPKDAPFPPRGAPLVVWQAGGPGWTMGNEWSTWVEAPLSLLPNFGIGVLIVPLPGRENYGPAFLDTLANRANFGQVDIDEQAEIVRQMIARGWTARGKVGIVGHSYGGYFTTQSIVRHPDLYAAANTQGTLVELIHEFQFGFPPVVAYLQGSTPQSNGAEYVRDSPLYNASRVKTPTLIFHGTEDFVDIRFMQSFHDQLKANDVPVRMLTFLGEGHALGNPASQQAAAEAQILWFRQYLGSE